MGDRVEVDVVDRQENLLHNALYNIFVNKFKFALFDKLSERDTPQVLADQHNVGLVLVGPVELHYVFAFQLFQN